MIKNYFKIAWRTLLRYKAYTGINIFGLTLSITAAILIFTLVTYQFSFESFNHNKDRIYRIVTDVSSDANLEHLPCVPQPLGKAFRNDFSFAEQTARIVYYRRVLLSLPQEKESKKFQEDDGVAFAEPSFFHIFDFPLVKGDPNTALANPHSALVTESIAKKYFGNTDAMGKTLRVKVFAGIAILISCLGLYGLVSFMALRRTKEIGIRKVLGAGVGQICWLFGKEFFRLLLIAFVIAAPAATMITSYWLRDFKYAIHPGPGLFLVGLLFSCLIAVIAVGYRSLKAAIANPINSLRSE